MGEVRTASLGTSVDHAVRLIAVVRELHEAPKSQRGSDNPNAFLERRARTTAIEVFRAPGNRAEAISLIMTTAQNDLDTGNPLTVERGHRLLEFSRAAERFTTCVYPEAA